MKYIPEIREDVIQKILIEVRKLQAAEELYKDAVNSLLHDAEKEMENKKSNFGKSLVPIILPEDVTSSASILSTKLTNIDNEISSLIETVVGAKRKASILTSPQITEELQKLERIQDECEYKKTRIEQDDQCVRFNKQCDEIEAEKKAIDQAIGDLESGQSDYLDEYFDKLTTGSIDLVAIDSRLRK